MIRLLLLIVAILISACSLIETADPAPPLLPPTGTVVASNFVSTFSEVCLKNYPETTGVVQAFEGAGFSTEFESEPGDELGYWAFIDEKEEMSGATGTVLLTFSGADGIGGGHAFGICNLTADLVDPDEIDAALAGLLAPTGNQISLGDFDEGSQREGNYEHRGQLFRVTLDQSKIFHGPYNPRASENCGGLDSCLTWGSHTLEVTPVEDHARING